MPLDSVSTFLSAHLASSRRSSQARLRSAVAHPFELGIEREQVDHLHLLVQSAFFRQIADAVVGGRCPGLVPAHRSGLHPDRRSAKSSEGGCFAGPVGPNEPVHRSSRHAQVQLVDGYMVAEFLG